MERPQFRLYEWSFSLQFIFFQNSLFRQLFDIRFSYKRCNFSHVCLLVKMASKTVTRSIIRWTDVIFEDIRKLLPIKVNVSIVMKISRLREVTYNHLNLLKPVFYMISTIDVIPAIAGKRGSTIVAIIWKPLSSDLSDNDRWVLSQQS